MQDTWYIRTLAYLASWDKNLRLPSGATNEDHPHESNIDINANFRKHKSALAIYLKQTHREGSGRMVVIPRSGVFLVRMGRHQCDFSISAEHMIISATHSACWNGFPGRSDLKCRNAGSVGKHFKEWALKGSRPQANSSGNQVCSKLQFSQFGYEETVFDLTDFTSTIASHHKFRSILLIWNGRRHNTKAISKKSVSEMKAIQEIGPLKNLAPAGNHAPSLSLVNFALS